ncbi:EAL domain-containing protein [Thalassotalea euphylliae]|uniref:EAL domain-containing protein n=1 Tax=Thalassotalea euphylliae TaxID=1655234 RepID=UPI003641CDB2
MIAFCYVVYLHATEKNALFASDISDSVKITTSYLLDDQGQFSADVVTRNLNAFKAVEPEDIPFSLDTIGYWVKFTITNKEFVSQQLTLHIDNTMLTRVNVYQATNGVFNDVKNSVDYHSAFPVLNVEIAELASSEYLLYLETGGPPYIALTWYSDKQFDTKKSQTRLLFGVVIGIFVVMALYNLVIYIAIKDKVYLAYLSYLISSFVVLSSVNGFGYVLFPVTVQNWINSYSLFFHYYLISSLLLFTVFFLKYDEPKGTIYKISTATVVILIAMSFSTQPLSHALQAKIFFSIPPVFYLFSLFLVIKRIKKQFAWAKFYFLSWIPLLIGAAVQPLVLLNHIEYSFLTRNAFLIAVIIEIALMAFALAERMRRHEIDRVNEISYDRVTSIPRKIMLEKAINEKIDSGCKQLSVLVIKPEHIERISLYVNDAMNRALFKRMYKKLAPLFVYNDAVIEIGRNGEKIALIGGKSLGILIDHRKAQQPLETLISSINILVEEAYSIEGLDIPLKSIVGVSHYPEHGAEAYVLLNRAQLAMTDAELSHARWAEFAEHQSDQAGYRLQLAADMNTAIEKDDFELFHQPQIDLKTMRVCGSECLLRWTHQKEGAISPAVFIPIAEDMGLINKLTRWVVKRSFTQHKAILESGYKNHVVSINVSGKDIMSEGFYEFIEQSLEAAELPANRVALELTESATITDNDFALEVIERLSNLGLTISIDDFGTGYSSLAYITKLPFQELKVDRQFVEGVNSDKKRMTIAETTVRMAKGLGLDVVAEGINSQEDEDTLRGFGCDIGQGFYYAKPMPHAEYIAWLGTERYGRGPGPLEGEFIPKAN